MMVISFFFLCSQNPLFCCPSTPILKACRLFLSYLMVSHVSILSIGVISFFFLSILFYQFLSLFTLRFFLYLNLKNYCSLMHSSLLLSLSCSLSPEIFLFLYLFIPSSQDSYTNPSFLKTSMLCISYLSFCVFLPTASRQSSLTDLLVH